MRWRIIAVATATALLAVVLLAVPLGVFVGHGYVNDERLELQRAAASAASTARGDRPGVAALGIDHSEIAAAIYDTTARLMDGVDVAAGAALVRSALRGQAATTTVGGSLLVSAPISDGDTVVAAVLLRSSLDPARHRAHLAWLVIAGIGLGAVLVAGTAAVVVAGRLSAPVERLRISAQRIGAGELDVRVAPSGVAELDTLATTLNSSAAQLATVIARERSFSAEVSHQLRTPLAGLRLDLDRAARTGAPDPHLDSARAAVVRLEGIIADVLALARDVPAERTSGVADLLSAVESRWRGPLAEDTRPLHVELQPALPAEIALSGRAAAQILDVLVDNAFRHGSGAVTVRARAAGGVVAFDVSDEGPALTTDPQILFRPRGGTHPNGIGLPFARKLAEAEGARLIVTSPHPPTFSLLAMGVAPA